MMNKHGVDLGWLDNVPAMNGEVKIATVKASKPKVTEASENEKRKYWSEYWRKRSHVAKGCATW